LSRRWTHEECLERFRAGDRRAVGRVISLIEQHDPEGTALLGELYRSDARAHRIGITGAPGVGKSTLVNVFAKRLSDEGQKLGVIAIDPSSPFTKGAFLGDRVRMQDVKGGNVFIRSMATRGSVGGLSWPAWLTAAVFEAFGLNKVIIETVGVGQVDVDVQELVDTTCVVLQPEAGDSMQFLKAGLMEIAHIYIVNKADKPGTRAMIADLMEFVKMHPEVEGGWTPPIVETVANEGQGLDELTEALDAHRKHLEKTEALEEKRRLRIRRQLKARFFHRAKIDLWNRPSGTEQVEAAVDRIQQGANPLEEADRLARQLLAGERSASEVEE